MLNMSFCSASLSLRTASLVSPLPLQPELYPKGLREALALLPQAHFVPAPHPSLTGGQTVSQAMGLTCWRGVASGCRCLCATWSHPLHEGCGFTLKSQGRASSLSRVWP